MNMKTKAEIKKQLDVIKKCAKEFEQKTRETKTLEEKEKYTLLYSNTMGYISALEWILK